MKLDIFGSCVTRDAFSFDDTRALTVQQYLGRQSFIGLQDKGVSFDEGWFEEVNPWERKCAFSALRKAEHAFPFSPSSDYLFVDYIDERLDLIDVEGSRVLLTKHVLQPRFKEYYDGRFKQIRRLSNDTFHEWREGAQIFFERAIAHYGPNKIILHKARWAPAFQDDEENVTPFSDEWSDKIARNNDLLSRYYEITEALVPELKTIEIEPKFIFADPAHKWSKEPFHYRREYYIRFLELVRAAVAAPKG